MRIVAGNWKMHHGPAAARDFADDLIERELPDEERVRLLLFPPTISLGTLAVHTLAGRVGLGVQNLHAEAEGAFTGEISAEMALEARAEWALVGHSERRHVFGETDEEVAAKVSACFRAGLRPMVCVGETLEERRAGKLEAVLERQLVAALDALGAEGDAPGSWALAYEPVWAIGTGETATPEDAGAAHAFLAERIRSRDGAVPPILYGGSVKPHNAAELMAVPSVDGVLVGGASLDPASFHAIATAATR